MTCLVTGNLTYIGWAKMDALGVKDLFTSPHFGGFGSDFCSGNLTDTWKDRAELVRIAAKKASEIHPGVHLISRSLHPRRIRSHAMSMPACRACLGVLHLITAMHWLVFSSIVSRSPQLPV